MGFHVDPISQGKVQARELSCSASLASLALAHFLNVLILHSFAPKSYNTEMCLKQASRLRSTSPAEFRSSLAARVCSAVLTEVEGSLISPGRSCHWDLARQTGIQLVYRHRSDMAAPRSSVGVVVDAHCVEVLRFVCVVLAFGTAALLGVDAHTTHSGFSRRSNAQDVMMATAPSPSGAGKSSGTAVFNIKTLGAKGDGSSDDTQWFLQAWASACASTAGTAMILVPKGYSFVMQDMTVFNGKKCLSNIVFQVDGTMLGPSKWKGKSSTSSWMQFTDCKNFILQGQGTLYARGESFWKSGGGPMGIRFLRSTNVAVLGITIKSTPQVHLKFNVANGVLIQGITIDSPELSPNTDGIHLQTNVYNVQILDCVIRSGDDCISIGTTTYNVVIKNIMCGPGHGISIGSLGTKGLLACVSDIDVSNVTFTNTLCGARIKTCAGGKGKAARISYRDIQVNNVKYPILVDQYYCGRTIKSDNVILDQIQFLDISGTAASSKLAPVTFDCAAPGCTNVRLQNINIVPIGAKTSASTCSNSYGTYGGKMNPPGCLQYKVGDNSRSYAGCSL